ncbi:MAG: hypothetical protein LUI12_05100 [Clostridiales bacterium]|nr:hypothetical protein [Clostridiales bacterium]
MQRKKTRYKDKNNQTICIGDVLHVEEYPDKYVGGSYDYDGVVEEDSDEHIVVTYYDIGEEESIPLSCFPKNGRELLTENQRYEYWRIAMLGAEPPEELWKWSD